MLLNYGVGCWRRLLRIPWTARRSNQSILKEISPEYSLEGLMLKLKVQYFGHLMQRNDSFEKTLMLERLRAGGEGDDRGWDSWISSASQWTWVWVISRSWWWTGRPGMLQSMGSQRVGHDWVTELNWTEPGGAVGKEPVCQFRRHEKWIWSLGWVPWFWSPPKNNVSHCLHCFPTNLPYRDLVWDNKDLMWHK